LNFPVVGEKRIGYATGQVDSLISRARRQYEHPALGLLDSSVLQAAHFEPVAGGYDPASVDAAIARIADHLEQLEIEKRVRFTSTSQLMREHESLVARIASVLLARSTKAFSIEPNGYRRAQVAVVMRQVRITDSKISELDTVALRTRPFGLARRGLSRRGVDEFMALVVSAILMQRAIF
jgi:DivIVA domain-containing protein